MTTSGYSPTARGRANRSLTVEGCGVPASDADRPALTAAGSPSLILPTALFARLVAHLRAASPWEGVGLLGGTIEPEGALAIEFYPGTNADASRTRYTMEPAEVLAAFNGMEAEGLILVAIVHSHPASEPIPSSTDLREAAYPEALVLIVGLGTEPPRARSWRLVPQGDRGRFEVSEVPIVVASGRDRASSEGERATDARGSV